jgi:hypothetical protein
VAEVFAWLRPDDLLGTEIDLGQVHPSTPT